MPMSMCTILPPVGEMGWPLMPSYTNTGKKAGLVNTWVNDPGTHS